MVMQVVSYIAEHDVKDIPEGSRVTEVAEDLNATKGRAQLAIDHLLSDYSLKLGKTPEEHMSDAERRVADAEAELERAREHQKTVANRTKSEKNGAIDMKDSNGSTTNGSGPKGSLPDDFPGKTALDAEGITTYAKAKKLSDAGELTTIPGIGDSTAEKITERLNADAKAS